MRPTLVFAIATLVACRDPFPAGLHATLEVSPDAVFAGDTVEVAFNLRNNARYPSRIRSSAGCLYFLETLRGDESVPWEGTAYGCALAITYFTIAPGDSIYGVHQLVAAEIGAPASGPQSVLPSGTYRIRTRMNADLPDLETRVVVLDPVAGR